MSALLRVLVALAVVCLVIGALIKAVAFLLWTAPILLVAASNTSRPSKGRPEAPIKALRRASLSVPAGAALQPSLNRRHEPASRTSSISHFAPVDAGPGRSKWFGTGMIG
jgi:hypothetical protein